jgi:CRISPR-associated endonuclease/helicase Cas3
MLSYEEFFQRATGFPPYQWQKHVAESGFPDVLPVPTGLGKTDGVVLAWAWRFLNENGEPRHLVYCLPMRTLVRQTVERIERCFKASNVNIGVYQLMGGAIEEEWVRLPEKPWVLVGTQDQLLSRALNRGYAMSRFEWPVHFGLLNNDCRWIIDEVQLMGPGLWTTAQLDWMRKKRFGTILDCPTTWMSATVGTGFLQTRDRERDGLHNATSLPEGIIERDPNREIQFRLAAKRPIGMWPAMDGGGPTPKRPETTYEALANAIKEKHVPGTLSLVICNTVEAARRVYERLERLPDDLPKVLLTSRFRRQDRAEHEKKLLDFEAKRKDMEARRAREGRTGDVGKPLPNDPGLICVSTQVVEAGVDISAHHLWSELAPWPSIIQRLGRLNRDGRDQEARAWFWEAPSEDPKKKADQTGPYEAADVERARRLIEALIPLSENKPFYTALEELKGTGIKDDVTAALQPRPEPMPRALDVHGLFSTERDVHGGFTDVSAFVRGADPDADLTVVWRDWEGGAKKDPPHSDGLDGPPLDVATEGCPVPFYRLSEALEKYRARAWIWNEEDDKWEKIRPEDLRAGMVVMLHRDAGGYSKELGWTGQDSDKIDDVPRAGRGGALRDDERTETGYWATLTVHLRDARREAERLCSALGIQGDFRTAVIEAAGWHDLGKAHPQWQSALPGGGSLGRGPWAKCPYVLAVDTAGTDACGAIVAEIGKLRPGALRLPDEPRQRDGKEVMRLRWAVDQRLKREELDGLRQLAGVRWAGHVPFRPGLRHEAASALAMWHQYRQGKADYPALAVYLAAAHHGKVRTVFRSLTDGGDDVFGVRPQPEILELNGERWQLDFTVVKDGAEGTWTEDGFVLTGHGWTGLVADLLGPWRDRSEDTTEAGVVPASEPRALGPFKFAYLEALVRIADWRVSAQPSHCIKPSEVRRDE